MDLAVLTTLPTLPLGSESFAASMPSPLRWGPHKCAWGCPEPGPAFAWSIPRGAVTSGKMQQGTWGLGLDPRGESPHGCRRALRRPSCLRVWQAPLHSGSTSYLTNPGNTLETAHGTVTGCQCLEWHMAAEANEPLRQGVSMDSGQEWGGSAMVPPLQWCPWLLTPRTQPTTQEATPRRGGSGRGASIKALLRPAGSVWPMAGAGWGHLWTQTQGAVKSCRASLTV